ncbi:MAG TPA: (Fe-S)-binding protein [Candidatus Baltobacteraceae bacterium]|nr:(Fe-S)-binding protein [Candidatus Baltobacteraceae bacterium]
MNPTASVSPSSQSDAASGTHPSPLFPQGFTGDDIPPESVYNQCVRCGLCLPTCPTYVETLVETSSPRGRIALIKAVGEGRLDLTSPGFVHQMSECLDCRACEAVCPSGVAYGQLLEPARTQVERALAPKHSIFHKMMRSLTIDVLFKHLALMRAAALGLRYYQRSGLRDFMRRSGILRTLHLEKLEAMAPPISSQFFIPRGQRWSAKGERKVTAVIHAGCVMHVAFAEVDVATVRVLQRSGCEVVAPPEQGCCGAIAIHAGDMDQGRKLAKQNIVAFEKSGADVYIVNAAGCGSSLKEYGHLFAEDPVWKSRAENFAMHVQDVTEFLATIGLGPGLGRIDGTVTYQEPCHLVHAQRISEQPRRLLALIPGLTLREMNESSLCCGSAGIYNVTQPEMAQRLQERKVSCALAVDPSVVATANPGCQLQLRMGIAKAGRTVPVKHIVELLDESYAAGDRDAATAVAYTG